MISDLIEFFKSNGFVYVEGEFNNIGVNQFQVLPINYTVEMNMTGGSIGLYNYNVELYFTNRDYDEFVNNFEFIKEVVGFCQKYNEYAGVDEISYEAVENYTISKLKFNLKVYQNLTRS